MHYKFEGFSYRNSKSKFSLSSIHVFESLCKAILYFIIYTPLLDLHSWFLHTLLWPPSVISVGDPHVAQNLYRSNQSIIDRASAKIPASEGSIWRLPGKGTRNEPSDCRSLNLLSSLPDTSIANKDWELEWSIPRNKITVSEVKWDEILLWSSQHSLYLHLEVLSFIGKTKGLSSDNRRNWEVSSQIFACNQSLSFLFSDALSKWFREKKFRSCWSGFSSFMWASISFAARFWSQKSAISCAVCPVLLTMFVSQLQ